MNTTLHEQGFRYVYRKCRSNIKTKIVMPAILSHYSKSIQMNKVEMKKLQLAEKFVECCGEPCLTVVCQCGCAARPATGVDRCHQSETLSTNTQQNNPKKETKQPTELGKAAEVQPARKPVLQAASNSQADPIPRCSQTRCSNFGLKA